MLSRVRRWWGGRSRLERLIVAVGVPVAAIAALWGARQDKAAKAAAAEDAEGGPGQEATTTTAARGPAVINAGAPGVSTSDLGSFTEVFSGEIGALEGSLATLEKQFGDTANERARRDAERAEELDRLRNQIGIFPGEGSGVPLDGAEQRPNENTGRKTDANRQGSQTKTDPDAQLREAIKQIFREEQLSPPTAGRLARLTEEVKRGRPLSDIRAGLETYKRNRPELGIPV